MTILRYAFSVCSALALVQSVIAADNVEFGRIAAPLALKRRSSSNSFRVKTAAFNKRKKNKGHQPVGDTIIDELDFSAFDRELTLDIPDIFDVPDIFDMSMSMSMSMSMAYGDDGIFFGPTDPSNPSSPSGPSNPSSPSGPSNPSSPAGPSNPSNPTPMSSPSATSYPSFAPIISPRSPVFTTLSPTFVTTESDGEFPSMLSLDPSETMGPTFFDEMTPSPAPTSGSFFPALAPTTVFNLSPEGSVGIAPPPHGDTTVVRLEIEYIVEGFVNTTNEFEAEVDRLILITSVMASLGASDSGVLGGLPVSRRLESAPAFDDNHHRNLLSSSYFLRLCNSTIVDANCYIMGADIVYILDAQRNADFAAYLAYLALNAEMGTYADDIPNVDRVEYLSPLPILPPVLTDDEVPSEDGLLTSGGETITFNRWAVGGAIGAAIAGLMALVVWCQNRRVRDQQHMHLLDDTSAMEPYPPGPRETAQRQVVCL